MRVPVPTEETKINDLREEDDVRTYREWRLDSWRRDLHSVQSSCFGLDSRLVSRRFEEVPRY